MCVHGSLPVPVTATVSSYTDVGFSSVCCECHWLIKKMLGPKTGQKRARQENYTECWEKEGSVAFRGGWNLASRS